jgi:hypothetical protein
MMSLMNDSYNFIPNRPGLGIAAMIHQVEAATMAALAEGRMASAERARERERERERERQQERLQAKCSVSFNRWRFL